MSESTNQTYSSWSGVEGQIPSGRTTPVDIAWMGPRVDVKRGGVGHRGEVLKRPVGRAIDADDRPIGRAVLGLKAAEASSQLIYVVVRRYDAR